MGSYHIHHHMHRPINQNQGKLNTERGRDAATLLSCGTSILKCLIPDICVRWQLPSSSSDSHASSLEPLQLLLLLLLLLLCRSYVLVSLLALLSQALLTKQCWAD